jgi:hypothetical protein
MGESFEERRKDRSNGPGNQVDSGGLVDGTEVGKVPNTIPLGIGKNGIESATILTGKEEGILRSSDGPDHRKEVLSRIDPCHRTDVGGIS